MPVSADDCETKAMLLAHCLRSVTEFAGPPWTAPTRAPNISRPRTGCGVGMLALASPICDQTTIPPFNTLSGLVPKKAGSQTAKSANLPGSIEPTRWETPWAMALDG